MFRGVVGSDEVTVDGKDVVSHAHTQGLYPCSDHIPDDVRGGKGGRRGKRSGREGGRGERGGGARGVVGRGERERRSGREEERY